MKKLIITTMMLLIAIGLLGIGTYGVFAKPDTSDPGSLSLNVIGRNTHNETYYLGNIMPGDSMGWDGSNNAEGIFWSVKNTGSTDGSIMISIEDIKDNGPSLSTQIMTQLWVNGLLVSESPDIAGLPLYKRELAPGEEIKVDIAWKFRETAGNEYQASNTEFNVRFDITSLPQAVITAPSAGNGSISVLSLTGSNNTVPLIGILILIIGFIVLMIYYKEKISSNNK